MSLLKRSDYDKFSAAWGEFLTRGGFLGGMAPAKARRFAHISGKKADKRLKNPADSRNFSTRAKHPVHRFPQ
jgi:hypothetical protein